jgi:anti-sigma B factor antagonist
VVRASLPTTPAGYDMSAATINQTDQEDRPVATRIEITTERPDDGISLLRLAGRLDIGSAADVKQAFAGSVADHRARVVVDLAGVTFIDSTGLSTLVSGLRTTRQAGGDLRLAGAGPQPVALFSLTSLDQVFRLYPTVEEALGGYRSQS